MAESVVVVDYVYECNLGTESDAFERFIEVDDQTLLTRNLFGKDYYVGAVNKEFSPLPSEYGKYDSRNNRLVNHLFKRLENQWIAATKDISSLRLGMVLGTSTAGMSDVESAMRTHGQTGDFPEDYHLHQHEISSPGDFLKKFLQINGPAYTISTACTSGSIALQSARRLILTGVCDVVLCGGVDTLCDFTLAGFSSLEAVSQGKTQAFSAARDGINIGEGGALFILRKATSVDDGRIQLLGGGESSDAHHQSAPHPEGRGAIAAMHQALADADLNASDIMYLNLHGTGTIQNDRMESLAVEQIFGKSTIACSSTKTLTGHLLGGAGSLEAAICCETLKHGENSQFSLPAQVWHGKFEQDLPELNLVTKATGSLFWDKPMAVCMSSSYAFGGSNSVLIFGKKNDC